MSVGLKLNVVEYRQRADSPDGTNKLIHLLSPRYAPVLGIRNTPLLVAGPIAATRLRATLLFVAEKQNITLHLPRELLKQIKRIAVDRDTSVSSLMTEALARLADNDSRYSAARRQSLAALQSARSLGTGGHRTWSRDELHER